jgi:hypothetical protein
MSTVALTNDNCLRDSVYHKVKRHIGMNAKSSISYKFPNDQGLFLKFSQKNNFDGIRIPDQTMK